MSKIDEFESAVKEEFSRFRSIQTKRPEIMFGKTTASDELINICIKMKLYDIKGNEITDSDTLIRYTGIQFSADQTRISIDKLYLKRGKFTQKGIGSETVKKIEDLAIKFQIPQVKVKSAYEAISFWRNKMGYERDFSGNDFAFYKRFM